MLGKSCGPKLKAAQYALQHGPSKSSDKRERFAINTLDAPSDFISKHGKDFGLFHARYLALEQKDRQQSPLEKTRDFDDHSPENCPDSEMPSFEFMSKTDLDAVNTEAIRILSSRFPNFDHNTITTAVQTVFKTIEIETKLGASPAPTTTTVPTSPSPTPTQMGPNRI